MTTTENLIPLNKLVLSAKNVRRKGKDDAIGELAANIAAIGLRQNLNVEPCEDGERFAVVAGGRRLRALKWLAKTKKIAKDHPVRCIVLTEGESAAEISLAENIIRSDMDPMDEFEAFDALVNGEVRLGVEDVAARFGVTPALVQRRLKLAQVSPKLRGLYRKGTVSLDILMAFTLTDDHEAQEQVWKDLPEWERSAAGIRRVLTAETVPLTDKLVRFVGEDAYLAAGGGIVRDLFDDTGTRAYLNDRMLLLTLAGAKLEGAVAEVQAEGWKWVKAEITPEHGIAYGWLDALPNDDEADETERFAPDDMARAGARLRIDHDGAVIIERGLVLPQDKPQTEEEDEAEASHPAKAKGASGPYSGALLEELTAHRTAALRLELARNPAIALAATVHAMALPVFYSTAHYGNAGTSCLSARISQNVLEDRLAEAGDCSAHQAMADERERWGDHLPGAAADFLPWCLAQPQDVLLDLLAYLAALSVNAVQGRHERADSERLRHSHALGDALGLDMAQHWCPSVAGFYGRVSKSTLLEIVYDAKVALPVNLAALKKGEGARYVESAVQGSGWLPEPLRARGTACPDLPMVEAA